MVESVSLRRVEVSELLHLAPIKPGFIPRAEQGDTFDPRLGYADRLRRVLSAFNTREEQGFPSVIRIFRGIHAASWALVDGDTRLLLNVTFDGDWHDYLSALVHHVPGFLHLIWGNCIGWERVDGRPERLFRFIQAHQVKTSFFYAHHPDLNVRDVDWLKRLRTVVDQLGDAPGSRAQLYAAVESALAPRSSADALRSALADYARDASATQPGLAGKDAVAIAQGAFRGVVKKCYAPADYALAFREAFGEDDQALVRATGEAAGAGPGPLDAWDAQSNVVRPFERAHCARMFFLHVPPQARLLDAAGRTQAQRWLEELTGQLDTSCVGFTPAGLRALGVSEAELAGLPDAFRQGMRARAQRLGDADPVGPEGLPDGMQPGSPGELHVLVLVVPDAAPEGGAPELERRLEQLGAQLRERGCAALNPADLRGALDAALDAPGQRISEAAARHGLVVLGRQDLHQPLVAGKPIEYFGFRDGVRQPVAIDARGAPLDPASLRQVLLAGPSPLLRNGSFLVLRQLAQDTQEFWRSMDALSARLGLASGREAAELVMGRRMDGTPLSGGDEQDPAFPEHEPDGAVCPFHSHVRRVNPRVDKQRPELNPTLLRRGMSYATAQAHGLMFMAFNADIATQFEFIQRNWVQSGSHTGQTSLERDPIAGIRGANPAQRPAQTQSGTSLQSGGQPVRVDLPAFVSVRWGGYFLVPGRRALALIAEAGFAGACGRAEQATGIAPLLAPLLGAQTEQGVVQAQALVRAWLDEPSMASQLWREVEQGRVTRVGRWAFVADPAHVRAILGDASGRYSVSGYMERMKRSSGKFFLGMDMGPDYTREHAATIIIPGGESAGQVDEIAYRTTHALAGLMHDQTAIKALSSEQRTVPISLQTLIGVVLNAVWSETLGVSGPSRGALAAWGRDLTRSLFRLAADAADAAEAARAGHGFRAHVDGLLAAVDDAQLAQALREDARGPAVVAILAAAAAPDAAPPARLKATAYRLCAALGARSATDDVVARNLLNVVTGSLGATAKLFLDGFDAFRADHSGRAGQLRLPEGCSRARRAPLAANSPYERVIMSSLAKLRRGGPDSLYRVFTGEGEAGELQALEQRLELAPGDSVAVWLGGMLALAPDAQRSNVHDYVFGAGFRSCPGMDVGKAIINGVLLALFELPDLRAADGPNVTFAFLPQQRPAPRP